MTPALRPVGEGLDGAALLDERRKSGRLLLCALASCRRRRSGREKDCTHNPHLYGFSLVSANVSFQTGDKCIEQGTYAFVHVGLGVRIERIPGSSTRIGKGVASAPCRHEHAVLALLIDPICL